MVILFEKPWFHEILDVIELDINDPGTRTTGNTLYRYLEDIEDLKNE
jgi:hypothetical protein